MAFTEIKCFLQNHSHGNYFPLQCLAPVTFPSYIRRSFKLTRKGDNMFSEKERDLTIGKKGGWWQHLDIYAGEFLLLLRHIIEAHYCASIREEIDCVKPNHYYGRLSFVITLCVPPHPIVKNAPRMMPGDKFWRWLRAATESDRGDRGALRVINTHSTAGYQHSSGILDRNQDTKGKLLMFKAWW